jgi:hypothetical protein
MNWLFFIAGIVYGLGVIISVRFLDFYNFPLFFVLAMLLVTWCYRSWTLAVEASVLLLFWLIFRTGDQRQDILLLLPVFVTLFIALNDRIRGSVSTLLMWAGAIDWVFLANTINIADWGLGAWLAAGSGLFALLIYSLSAFTTVNQVPGKVDVLLCSYSGNTAKYTGHFVQALEENGVQVTMHQFHHYRDFTAELEGDGLVLAFPVIGWKPPWPLFYYIWKKLPAGLNRPAYILYTCSGSPENTGFLIWLMLTMKGYKVLGRAWGLYPLNVAPFRILSKKPRSFLDRVAPQANDSRVAQEGARAFCQGQNRGLPLIFWPFPLFILGSVTGGVLKRAGRTG